MKAVSKRHNLQAGASLAGLARGVLLRQTLQFLILAGLCLAWARVSAEVNTVDKPVSSDSAGATAVAAKGPPADNSRCFVCHANYDLNDEKLALGHAQAGIGCVRCHGESSPHSTDEDGLTAPDRIYPQSHIRFNCLGCHDSTRLVASDKTKLNRVDLKEKPDHLAVLNGTSKDKKICTDCHGEHRLGYRTRKWNKRTKLLIYRDATPQMIPEGSSLK